GRNRLAGLASERIRRVGQLAGAARDRRRTLVPVSRPGLRAGRWRRPLGGCNPCAMSAQSCGTAPASRAVVVSTGDTSRPGAKRQQQDADPDMPAHEDIEALLAALRSREPGAMDRLVEAVYPALKRLAHFQLAGERQGHTLTTTAIVHEAYLRMATGDARWSDRKHFLRAAATVMRHLLVDHARQRDADKRGGGQVP